MNKFFYVCSLLFLEMNYLNSQKIKNSWWLIFSHFFLAVWGVYKSKYPWVTNIMGIFGPVLFRIWSQATIYPMWRGGHRPCTSMSYSKQICRCPLTETSPNPASDHTTWTQYPKCLFHVYPGIPSPTPPTMIPNSICKILYCLTALYGGLTFLYVSLPMTL